MDSQQIVHWASIDWFDRGWVRRYHTIGIAGVALPDLEVMRIGNVANITRINDRFPGICFGEQLPPSVSHNYR